MHRYAWYEGTQHIEHGFPIHESYVYSYYKYSLKAIPLNKNTERKQDQYTAKG